jgi:predicted lipoprotein with Yx(FWY)xxD motif
MLGRCLVAAPLLCLPAACGDSSGPPAGAPASTPSAAVGATRAPAPTVRASTAPGTRIAASSSAYGQMLFDGTGQAIYLFDVETTTTPECYDACAAAWPPVLTTGAPVAGQGVERALLSTTQRADGTVQVTYNDHPLYFYAHEGKREVKCHDIFLNGGNWYVVQPGGDPAPPG